MDLRTFLAKRDERNKKQKEYRAMCDTCRQPDFGCYCSELKAFDPKIKFIILIHPIERRRRIATGRMSHLSLSNSELITGYDFSDNDRINEIISDPQYEAFVLYPGKSSVDISRKNERERKGFFSPGKTPVVFVIDGTWATAKKMMNKSKNLKTLQRISFTPQTMSRFRVRKQPNANCFSTIEAIHQTIDLLGVSAGVDISVRPHDGLLSVFNFMVEKQIKCINDSFDSPRPHAYRRIHRRPA